MLVTLYPKSLICLHGVVLVAGTNLNVSATTEYISTLLCLYNIHRFNLTTAQYTVLNLLTIHSI